MTYYVFDYFDVYLLDYPGEKFLDLGYLEDLHFAELDEYDRQFGNTRVIRNQGMT